MTLLHLCSDQFFFLFQIHTLAKCTLDNHCSHEICTLTMCWHLISPLSSIFLATYRFYIWYRGIPFCTDLLHFHTLNDPFSLFSIKPSFFHPSYARLLCPRCSSKIFSLSLFLVLTFYLCTLHYISVGSFLDYS